MAVKLSTILLRKVFTQTYGKSQIHVICFDTYKIINRLLDICILSVLLQIGKPKPINTYKFSCNFWMSNAMPSECDVIIKRSIHLTDNFKVCNQPIKLMNPFLAIDRTVEREEIEAQKTLWTMLLGTKQCKNIYYYNTNFKWCS